MSGLPNSKPVKSNNPPMQVFFGLGNHWLFREYFGYGTRCTELNPHQRFVLDFYKYKNWIRRNANRWKSTKLHIPVELHQRKDSGMSSQKDNKTMFTETYIYISSSLPPESQNCQHQLSSNPESHQRGLHAYTIESFIKSTEPIIIRISKWWKWEEISSKWVKIWVKYTISTQVQ